MRIYKIDTNGDCQFLDISGELDSLQAQVGGYIEGIYSIDGSICAYVNEEGKLQGLPCNSVATRFALQHRMINEWDVIAGPMILLGPADDEGRSTDCPEDIAALVEAA